MAPCVPSVCLIILIYACVRVCVCIAELVEVFIVWLL